MFLLATAMNMLPPQPFGKDNAEIKLNIFKNLDLESNPKSNKHGAMLLSNKVYYKKDGASKNKE